MSSVGDFLDQLKAYGQDLNGAPEIDLFSGGFRRSSAPFLIGKAGMEASRLLGETQSTQFRQFAEGYGQAETKRSDDLRYGLAESGVNAVQAQRMMTEAGSQRGSQVAQFRAGLENQRAQGELGVLGEVTSGLVQSEQYQDSLDLQRYIADQQAAAAKKAGKYKMIGTIGGAVAGAFTGGLGTALMGGMAGMAGGGTPGMGSKLNMAPELGGSQPSFNFGSPGGGAGMWGMGGGGGGGDGFYGPQQASGGMNSSGYGPQPISWSALSNNLFKVFQ